MRKLIIVLCLISIISLGCTSKSNDNDFEKEFNEKQVINKLSKEGVTLTRIQTMVDEQYILNGTKPSVYKFKNNDNFLYIYTFNTLADRKEVGIWNHIVDF